MNKTINVTKVIKDAMLPDWYKPVAFLITDKGEVFCTEFYENARTGVMNITTSFENNKGYTTAIIRS